MLNIAWRRVTLGQVGDGLSQVVTDSRAHH
jgi:hypothetical protein